MASEAAFPLASHHLPRALLPAVPSPCRRFAPRAPFLLLLSWLASCMAGIALLAPAALATVVFHSPNDDGVPGAQLSPGNGQPIFLYIDGGPTASAPGRTCHDGAGDELCGFTIELTALAGVGFTSFTPEPSADLMTNLVGGSLRINGLDTEDPTPGPQRIGTLLVDAPQNGEVELTSGEVIGADLESETLAPQTTLISVPEPGVSVMLLGGGGLLSLLARWRRRR